MAVSRKTVLMATSEFAQGKDLINNMPQRGSVRTSIDSCVNRSEGNPVHSYREPLMSFSNRSLADVRLWLVVVLIGLTLVTSACSSSDESSCQPGDDDYPGCLDA
jgi:hypothetical protein